MKTMLILALALMLAACAGAPWDDGCTTTEIHYVGTTPIERCAGWEFGPSLCQQKQFAAGGPSKECK